MLHVRVSQSLNSQCGAFTVPVFHTVVFLALTHSCRGQSEVIGPSQPIVAIVGDDITLPCYLDPDMDVSDMILEWVRPDLDPRFVIVWRDGVELQSKKHPSYKGRTSLFTDELKHGNVSLKLSKVKISDEGRYRCFIPELVKDSIVQLVVGGVSLPVKAGINRTSSGVVLQCECAGWYPEPEVLWLDAEGNLLSAGPTETVRGPDDLYTVSSRLTVEKRHSNSFTCRVQQKDIHQTRETQIYVPDDFFRDLSSSSSSAPTIIGLVVGIMFILAAVFFVWKWRQNKIRNKKDEETQKSYSACNNSEQESLMDREREQLTAERGTINNVNEEETRLQTQTDEETAERGTESDPNNEEDETKSGSDNTEQPMEERLTENNVQTDEGEETAERETPNHLDKDKENLVDKLKTKERELRTPEETVSRCERQMKDNEDQIKLKLQPEEVEKQREETERKLQSVNREEDKMDPETQEEAAEKHEAVRRLSETTKDLEKKKAEPQKQLERRETQLEGKKDSTFITKKKLSKRRKPLKDLQSDPESRKSETDADESQIKMEVKV